MKAIMVIGTSRESGKSFLCAALCRILARKGWRVTPFKAESITTTAYMTGNGTEISFATASQAWAAKVTPLGDMNPIVLKIRDQSQLEVFFQGESQGMETPLTYYREYQEPGWQKIKESLQRLSNEFDLILAEGNGSAAELHLKPYDNSNLRLARYLHAPTLLIADSKRDGVFAQIIGTLELLDQVERSLIKGIIINKFQGDRVMLQPGISELQSRTGIPVLGVIPYLNNIFATKDDALNLLTGPKHKPAHQINITIIRLPRASNYTDFDPLEAEPTIAVQYLYPNQPLGYPDAVIIPATRKVIADLLVLQKTGMAEQLKAYAEAGGTILGICGGFQMLGQQITDSELQESPSGGYPGLKLLPIKTTLEPHRAARQRQIVSNYPQSGLPLVGYEVAQGRTRIIESNHHKQQITDCEALFDDPTLGYVNNSQTIWGCYLHGLFDNGPWRRAWLNNLRQQRGLSSLPTGVANYREQRELILDLLADVIEEYLDLSPILPSN